MAATAARDPAALTALVADIRTARETGLSRVEETRRRLGDPRGKRLLAQWRTTLEALCRQLGAMAPDARLKWVGPDMGVRMFTTARQMETWAHAQAIWDLLGRERKDTDRLRNIAEIGVRTYGWTFANRGHEPPGPPPCVRLTAPSGAVWEWHPENIGARVEGSATEFCQVVTQTRNVADTQLVVQGDTAEQWMAIAQCFAGPPEPPPAPGTRQRAAQTRTA
jgi:uncharacterized protein (TIGR03084 family)